MKTLFISIIRKSWFYIIHLILSSSLLTLPACQEEEEIEPMPKTITDVVVEGEDFTLLEAALIRAGLADALRTGTRTVFAPTDAAFKAAGFGDVNAVNALPVATLQAVLQYHVLDGIRIVAGDIPAGDNTTQSSLGGSTLYITKKDGTVSVNGARVTTADVAAANGVIHVIDRVLLPPAGNLVETVGVNPNFSFLVAAVRRAGLVSTLSGNGPFTVFAPTNDAFRAAGFNSEEDIRNADTEALTRILTYHVVPARAFSTNLSGGNLTTVQGGTVAITLESGISVRGNGNGSSASRVTSPDILASNGVIHVIDRVLLP